MYCSVCGSKIRNPKYQLHYIGFVCSKCNRMSAKNYCKLVDEIAIKKMEYILKEIKKIKELHSPLQ